MDLTILAFAQWVSEMKNRQSSCQHQLRAEMSKIRNATTSNHTDLSDFKRHGAAIQQQMQSEINEIRESLSNVFMEITGAVRNKAAADQDIKLKIQSLNEQAVRNETAFAQLADAADQSQSKLRSAVTEMQLSSERMRDELGGLSRHCETIESNTTERVERINSDMDQLSQDLTMQLERRREHLRKMVNDVVTIGESLQSLVADFGEQRKASDGMQGKLHTSLYSHEQSLRRDGTATTPIQPAGTPVQPAGTPTRGLPPTVDVVPAYGLPQVPSHSMLPPQGFLPPGHPMWAAGGPAAPPPYGHHMVYR